MTSLTNSTPIAYRKTGSQAVKINTKENLPIVNGLVNGLLFLVENPICLKGLLPHLCGYKVTLFFAKNSFKIFWSKKYDLCKRSSSAFVRL